MPRNAENLSAGTALLWVAGRKDAMRLKGESNAFVRAPAQPKNLYLVDLHFYYAHGGKWKRAVYSPGKVDRGTKMGGSVIKLCAALLLVATALTWPRGSARAAEIAAIVEELSASIDGIQPMDLLEEGRVIELGEGVTLTLGYLRSCIRETITGGRVTVGQDESKVDNGTRVAEEVDCDGGLVIKSSNRGNEVAAAVFRQGKNRGKKFPKPQWTVFGTNPVLRLSKPSTRILIERIDKEDESPIELAVDGLLVDLSKLGVLLQPGGLYSISDGSASYVLKVSPLAVPDAPLLSRLIPM